MGANERKVFLIEKWLRSPQEDAELRQNVTVARDRDVDKRMRTRGTDANMRGREVVCCFLGGKRVGNRSTEIFTLHLG